MKSNAFHGALLALCGACLAVAPVWAEGYGPEQVILQATLDKEKIPRPAYLPHHTHQWLDCDGCHHSKGSNGKKVDWVPGQKVEQCETCHNTATAMQQRLSKLKYAGHRLCLECHLQNDKDLARCGVCHNKK